MPASPYFSIIIPAYNAEEHIFNCVKSILCQRYYDFEIIVIDGKSTDATVSIIHQFEDARIRLYSEKDHGIYDAMNRGIQKAAGDWLYFLGSDDVLFDELVLSDVALCVDEKCDVLYGNVVFKKSGKIYDGKFTRLKLMEKNICHQAIFYHKRIFAGHGSFKVRYKLLADYEFNIRWFNDNSVKRRFVDRAIAVYDEDGSSFRTNDIEFIRDKDAIYASQFPWIIRYLFSLRSQRLVRLFMTFSKRYLIPSRVLSHVSSTPRGKG